MKKYTAIFCFFLTLTALFSACKKDYDSIEVIDDAAINAYIKKNNLDMTKDESGVYYQVVTPGTGDVFANKDSVLFTYQEKSILDGSTYYSTNANGNEGTYFGYMSNTFNGAWGKALNGQKYGAKVRILVPSRLAYGKNGNSTYNVPSNAILDTYITTSTFKKQYLLDDNKIQTFLTAKGLTAVKDPSRVYYIRSTAGAGTDEISLTSTLVLKYTGRFLDGTVFDSSTDGTFSYVLGNLIKGWGILTKEKAGAKIRIFIPSDLAYGTTASGSVPANAVLDFDIEIVSVTN
jgi:FKBP-type peptidyl-prolyl cis-trans isomerase FkpA